MASTPKPAKTMSSRLLTMRFMQRSIASSPTSSSPRNSNSNKTTLGASPTSTSPRKFRKDHHHHHHHQEQQQPPSKRQRLSNDSPAAVPPTSMSGDDHNYDDAMRAALAAEEALRVQADERRAKVRGESRWALSFMNPQYPTGKGNGSEEQDDSNPMPPFQVVTAGYGDIDAFTASKGEIGNDRGYTSTFQRSNESKSMHDSSSSVGRRTFGKYKRQASEVAGNSTYSNISMNNDAEEEEEDEEEDEDEDDDEDENTNSDNSSDSRESDTSSSVSSRTSRRKQHTHAQENPRRQDKKVTATSPTSSKNHRSQAITNPKEQKKVSTRRLTSISAAGAAASDDSRIVCHRCMVKGHKLKDCPKMVRVGDRREQRGPRSGERGGKGYKRAPMGL